jgi:hypothetical protein
MENITSADGLKIAIQRLEVEQAEKWQLLKNQSLQTVDIFKPANLLKNAAKGFLSSPHLMDHMLDTVVGLATGLVTRKLIVGSSFNIIRKILGSVMQLGITTIATKNSDSIQSFGRFVLHRITAKKDRIETSRS